MTWIISLLSAALVIVIMFMFYHKGHEQGYTAGVEDGKLIAKREADNEH